MAMPGVKHLLEALRRLLLRCTEILQYYVAAVSRSPLLLQAAVWLALLVERPWFRKGRNVVYQSAALVVGSTYEDEREAFSAQRLVHNDAYRDRLLVPEIEDLVALCDALSLTLAQRKAFFQCFLHVDFMRRSSVSRAELLRYCGLRATPLSAFLLPNAATTTHRAARNRWDILQLLAACFSICTAELTELVQLAVAEGCRSKEEGDEVPATDQEEGQDHEKSQAASETRTPAIYQQIGQCLTFFVGIPNPSERNLQSLLITLYSNSPVGEEETVAEEPTRPIDFLKAHGVTSIVDVVRLFPVLVFPCIWMQRVLRMRILGATTWQCLQRRREQLQPYTNAASIFLSVSDIVTASQTHLYRKNGNLEDSIDHPGVVGKSSAGLITPPEGGGSGSSRLSTPRKIVPGREQAKPEVETNKPPLSASKLDASSLTTVFEQCSTLESAWRVTANHALASVFIQCCHASVSEGDGALAAEFQRVTKEISDGKLGVEQCERIRLRLVRDYGYRFAQFLLGKSSLKELSHASKTPLEERRAQQRYSKAWSTSGLVDDKTVYWKEFEDPAAKRAFYYNVRTGESRWEKPVNFASQSRLKKRKKRRKTDDADRTELVKVTGKAVKST